MMLYTKCLETMYKRLDNTSLSIEQSCDGLERHTDIYYESMNDSISQAAVEKAREIHSGVSKKREMIIGIRNDLQTAKSQLDAYLSHAGMFL